MTITKKKTMSKTKKKMIMKTKIFNIALALTLGLGATSCNDWLTVEPSTEMDREELFQNEDGFADAMSGIYVSMSADQLYGKNLTWWFMELIGGTAHAGSSLTNILAQYPFNKNTPYTYYQSHQMNYVDPIWRKAYNTIANVNSVINNIDEHKNVFTGKDYNVFKGEALGLRAFLHFDVMRIYSDAYASNDFNATKKYIPYVKTMTSDVYPLLTADQLCDQMLADLKEAKELLKDDPMYTGATASPYVCSAVSGRSDLRERYNIKDWHNRRLHFNYYAAVATMARIYLWKGDKANALACAKEVIDAQDKAFFWVNTDLVANTQSTSNQVARDRTFCTEHIFAMNVDDLTKRIDGILQQGEKAFTSTNSLIAMYTDYCFDITSRDDDIRYKYLKYEYNSTFLIPTKYWQDEDKDADGTYFPWARKRIPLIKAAEMYFIAAECEPDLDKAVGYVEAVRKHRGLAPHPLTVASRDELETEINKEYRKEFISEGQMFYFNKRKNNDIKIKGMTGTTVYTINPAAYTMERPDDEDTYAGRE